MTEPGHHIFRKVDFHPVRHGGALDHQHRQAELAGCRQLGCSARAARILAYDEINGVVLHQAAISLDGEGAAVDHQAVMRQGRRLSRRIDEPQEVMVLRLRGEGLHMHPPQRQHDAPGWASKHIDCRVNVAGAKPAIAGNRHPGGPGQHDMRNACNPGGFDRMGTHLGGKGVGRIHEVRDVVVPQVIDQASNPAEATDTGLDRLGLRRLRSAGIAERGLNAFFCEQARQRACLRRAAQEENIRHG